MALGVDPQGTSHVSGTPVELRAPLLWGAVVGVLQALSPWALWWLPPATVHALGLAFIAAIYAGLSVADGLAGHGLKDPLAGASFEG